MKCRNFRLIGLLLVMAVMGMSLTAQAQEKADTLISLKKADLRLGGELEFEFRDTQKDDGIKDHKGHFQFDKFTLKTLANFPETDVSLYGEFDIVPDGISVAEAWICFKGFPLNAKFSAGFGDRFIGISRKTEVYPMLATSMWRYEQYQIRLEAEISPVYLGVWLGDGLTLGTKQVSEDSSYKMLRDNRNAGEKTGHNEYGGKLGFKTDIGSLASIDLMGFGIMGELSKDDIALLNSKLPEVVAKEGDEDKMTRYGARAVFNLKFNKQNKSTLVAEVGQFKDGELTRNGWYVQGSHKVKTGNVYFCSFEPLIRYGQLKPDCEQVFSKPASWERKMITLALITEVAKNVKVKTEYYINNEETGDDEVDNNEILVQLEYKF